MESKGQPPPIGRLLYRDPRHEFLPHVVKFSGGRSSAALVLEMAAAGALIAERGDVVLFANTSAEHPRTYEFADRCCEEIEHHYGLPCFWYEFCTVEDAYRGVYRRRLSYRLVTRRPIEDDPNGYRSRGETFEEFLSFQGMLPNPHSRSCTAKLKLYPAHLLLEEWLGGTAGPRHDGHYSNRSFVDGDASERRYRAHRGIDDSGSFRMRVACVLRQPPSRRRQRWSDFTGADATRSRIGKGEPVTLWGRPPTEFVTLLGLRADEQPRVWRILDRTLFAEGAGSAKCAIRTQPPGEHPYFPLADAGWTANDVDTYWSVRGQGLQLPAGAGNCVFCFMKGTHDLRAVAQSLDPDRVADTPSDIGWWDSIERRYRRKAPARDGSGHTVFGFFGVNGPSYADIANTECVLNGRYTTGSPACDCTD
ncbi:MAG: hypothetical protein OYK82_12865 [Gammaproteobacteria bacterium]|nr:hypothetical protein [Gammaproteobacteria bacterium]